MTRHTFRRAARTHLAIAASALGLVATAHAAVGAKIGLQAWDPSHPDQERMVVPYDHPSAVSDAVMQAWNDARAPLCALMRAELGHSNRFASGVTLYNIDCRLQAAAQFTVRQLSANQLEVAFGLARNTLIASATTPTILTKGYDPRASLDFDFDVRVAVSIQPNAAKTIEVTQISSGVSRTHLDSQNLTADVLKAGNSLLAFVSGTDMKQMAEGLLNRINTESQRAADGRPLGVSMRDQANALLAPVNQALAVPLTHVQAGAWFHNGKIVLAFAPRNLPAPSMTGAIEGVIHWPASVNSNGGCESFRINARVQTGPSPITGPALTFGAAPLAWVGSYAPVGQPYRDVDRLACRYRISGLPAAVASQLVPALPQMSVVGQHAVSGSGSMTAPVSFASLRPEGWTEAYVTPAPTATHRDFVALVQTINPHIGLLQKPTLQPTPLTMAGGSTQAALPINLRPALNPAMTTPAGPR